MLSLPLLAACGAGSGNDCLFAHGDTIALQYARNLTMVDYGEFVKADFRNPWDTTRILQTYILLPTESELPAHLPQGTVVRVPLSRSVVYTSVHNSLIDELGAIDGVAGVCDSKYIYNASLRERIGDGRVADCGTSSSPDIERILMLNPDALLLSAFENSNDHNKVAQTGVPIIDCTDYMESSPLARAEWMRFFGRLYGKGAEADSMFGQTVLEYSAIREKVAGHCATRPVVLTDCIYGQTWGVPGAQSTTGIFINDAGGRNPFDSYDRSGSVQLAPEEVLYTAGNADVWLLRYARQGDMTLSALAGENSVYTRFAPFATGNVYGCNTAYSAYFEEIPFHPQWLLAELAALIHPETGVKPTHRYFKKLTAN